MGLERMSLESIEKLENIDESQKITVQEIKKLFAEMKLPEELEVIKKQMEQKAAADIKKSIDENNDNTQVDLNRQLSEAFINNDKEKLEECREKLSLISPKTGSLEMLDSDWLKKNEGDVKGTDSRILDNSNDISNSQFYDSSYLNNNVNNAKVNQASYNQIIINMIDSLISTVGNFSDFSIIKRHLLKEDLITNEDDFYDYQELISKVLDSYKKGENCRFAITGLRLRIESLKMNRSIDRRGNSL